MVVHLDVGIVSSYIDRYVISWSFGLFLYCIDQASTLDKLCL